MALEVTVELAGGSLSVAANTTPFLVQMVNDDPTGHYDRFEATTTTFDLFEFPVLSTNYSQFSLIDTTQTAFDSIDLPTMLSLAPFDGIVVSIGGNTGDPDYQPYVIGGTILSLAPVPAPTPFFLLASSLLGLYARRRFT